jgi:hypothetical protein
MNSSALRLRQSSRCFLGRWSASVSGSMVVSQRVFLLRILTEVQDGKDEGSCF